MKQVHLVIAYAVPAGFILMALWAAVGLAVNHPPGDKFWRLVALVQVVLGVQIVLGTLLFIGGGRPQSNGPRWLHYVYGGLFPVAVLVYAHRRSRRSAGVSWMVFGLAAVVIFGLTFRALQTGLGTD